MQQSNLERLGDRCCTVSKTLTNYFLNVFILMWQKRKRVRNIVPLSFGLTTRQTWCQFISKLLSMFLLVCEQEPCFGWFTFSMNDMRNLTILLREFSSRGFLSEDSRLKISVKPLYIALSLVDSSVKNIFAKSAIRRSSSSRHLAISPSCPLTLTWPANIKKVRVMRHVFLTDGSLSLSRR